LIDASVAGPPSPSENANPFPATVVMVPIVALGAVDEVAAPDPFVDRSDPAGLVSEPEQAAVANVKLTTIAIEDIRFGLVDSGLPFISIPPR
jgi:hypothetical protein